MGVIARLWVEVGADTKKFETGVKNIQQKLGSLQKNLNTFGNVMTLGVTLPIVALFKGLLDAGMQLESTEAKFNTVFEGMTDDATAFIKEFKKLTPLTTSQARGVAMGIQDLLVPLGFLREDATDMTGKFMLLTGALANFNNTEYTTAEVADKVRQALVGQYEGIRDLGIVTDRASIDQHVLTMGLAATKDEITEQMRVMALYDIMMDSSQDAVRAYTEANLDAKTELELLKVKFGDAAEKLGTSLLPMFEKAIEFVEKLADYFFDLTVEQQENILKWLGFAAVIGPASKVAAAVVGMTNMIIGLKTALLLSKVAAAGLSGAAGLGGVAPAAGVAAAGVGTATAIMLGKIALVAAAVVALIILFKSAQNWDINVGSAPNKMGFGNQAGTSGSKPYLPVKQNQSVTNSSYVPSSGMSYTQGNSFSSGVKTGVGAYTSGSKISGAFAALMDSGGIVPGPIGSLQPILAHGGETVLPTHKPGWQGSGSNTIRHEIDLINVPATVDGASLERTLVEMLNAPQVKRKIDRVNYENQIGAVRGLGA